MRDKHKDAVREMLEEVGYHVADIPEGDEVSADLLATTTAEDTLVTEVKSRREDVHVAAKLSSSPPGEIVSTKTKIAHDDDLSDIVHDAAAQIQASQRVHPGIGVLWFRADPLLGIADADSKMVATLLGTRDLLVGDGSGQSKVARCYLANYADFFNYECIDLAVIEDEKGNLQLLVNPYSTQLDRARSSRLLRFFVDRDSRAVIDVAAMHESDTVYILFGDFSRKDEAAVLDELRRRNPGKKFAFFDIHGFGGYTRA